MSYHNERIGLTDTARWLNVSVGELKDAVRRDTPLRGVQPPRPAVGGVEGGRGMLFTMGEVERAAQRLKDARS